LTLCETGNPTLTNFSAILRSVGLKIEVVPIERAQEPSGQGPPPDRPIVTPPSTPATNQKVAYQTVHRGLIGGFLSNGTAAGNNAYGGQLQPGTAYGLIWRSAEILSVIRTATTPALKFYEFTAPPQLLLEGKS
jgi:hypothetical protein